MVLIRGTLEINWHFLRNRHTGPSEHSHNQNHYFHFNLRRYDHSRLAPYLNCLFEFLRNLGKLFQSDLQIFDDLSSNDIWSWQSIHVFKGVIP